MEALVDPKQASTCQKHCAGVLGAKAELPMPPQVAHPTLWTVMCAVGRDSVVACRCLTLAEAHAEAAKVAARGGMPEIVSPLTQA